MRLIILHKNVIQLSLLFLITQITGCVNAPNSDLTPIQDLTPIKNASVKGCYLEKYTDPKASEYILPFEVGKSFRVSQGNCGRYQTHRPKCTAINRFGNTIKCGDARYSYDFSIPIGINIVAARSGVVISTEHRFSNFTKGIHQINFVTIDHKDGTASAYFHLSPNGVLVEEGDKVSQGDVIGIAGNSGFTGGHAHLHFHVVTPPFDRCSNGNYAGCSTVPVTFRNASPLDGPLVEWTTYKALLY